MRNHLVIPDAQIHRGIPLSHIQAIGNMIVEERPHVIINIGDWADMPSLSSYDKGTRGFEGRRYKEDISSSKEAMVELLTPLWRLQGKQKKNKEKLYKPLMVLTLGNHEHRIERATNTHPELFETISWRDLEYEEMGWLVMPFLKPIEIDGVTYVHYVQNINAPTAISRAHLIAQKRHGSFTVGHQAGLDYYVSSGIAPHNNRRVQCIIAGSCYMHDEDYRGYQGNQHWRGVIYKRNVKDGEYDPEFISINSLLDRYS